MKLLVCIVVEIIFKEVVDILVEVVRLFCSCIGCFKI